MRSKAIAGVDGWLKQAEEVLRDQEERSLSPSLTPQWNAGQVERTITMAEFAEEVEGVLRILSRRPGRWVLIVECGPYRYWQVLAFEDGSVVAEVISNQWIAGVFRWTPLQEEGLQDLGWSFPDPPHRPNWLKVEATTSPDLGGVAQQAVLTLRKVFGMKDEDKLLVKQFSSPNRGGTPATPTYGGVADPGRIPERLSVG